MEIKINIKSKNYSIFIGSNILKNCSKIFTKKKIKFKKALIIIDKNIPTKFRKILISNLKIKQKFLLYFKANEKNKSLSNVNKIHSILFQKNFNRDDCIISFGGGITGDLSGFAASTYKRGLKFINIPTTLLAQVDSSIGGKTGINNNYGKNLVGSFYQPEIVISDTDLLKSLPKRELVCGYAEILKSAIIDSKSKFIFLDKNLFSILSLKKNIIEKAIFNSCSLKKRVVEKDEKEKNIRKVLNLGHTFGHSFEATLKFSKVLNHGEAVILGIKRAINYSKKLKIISKKNFDLINNHINQINLNKKFKKLFKKKDIDKIIKYMKSDKKNNSDKINLILVENFGNIKLNYNFSLYDIKKFLLSELK